MAMMVGSSPQFLHEKSKPLDDAGVSAFFDPATVQNLYAAIRHAWQLIVVLEPVSEGRRDAMIDALAVGVLRAANAGERDVGRLARAACWYLISRRRHGDAATPSLALQ
jgi:hypothetical protein